MSARIAGFSMVFFSSDFIGGCEEFARLHGRQALWAGRVSRGPARAEEARLGDPGDGDGVGLVAAEDEEVRVVLAHGEADMAAGAALKHKHSAGHRFGFLPEQQPVARPVGICAQRAEQGFIAQADLDAGLDEIAASRGFGRIAQGSAIALQPIHQPRAVSGLVAPEGRFGFGDPGQGALRRE